MASADHEKKVLQVQARTPFTIKSAMPRAKKSLGKSRHDPLLVQLDEDEVEARYGRISQPGKRKKSRHSSNAADEESAEVGSYHSICH